MASTEVALNMRLVVFGILVATCSSYPSNLIKTLESKRLLYKDNSSTCVLLNLNSTNDGNVLIADDSTVILRHRSRMTLAVDSRLTVFDGGKLSSKSSTIYAENTLLTIMSTKIRCRRFAKMFLRNADVFVKDLVRIKQHSTLSIGMDDSSKRVNDTRPKELPNLAIVQGKLTIKNNSAIRMASDSSFIQNTSGTTSLIKHGRISLAKGASLELHDHSYLEVWDNSSLRLGRNAKLFIIGESWLRIDFNSIIVIDDNTNCLVLHSYADYRMVDRKAVVPMDIIHGFYCNRHHDIDPWTFWSSQIEEECSRRNATFCESGFFHINRADLFRRRRSTLKWQYTSKEVSEYEKSRAILGINRARNVVLAALLVVILTKQL